MEIKQVLYKDIDDALETRQSLRRRQLSRFLKKTLQQHMPLSGKLRIRGSCLSFVEGVWCVYNETLDTLEPDWSVTLVYEDTENFDIDKFDYFEQGTPTVAIHNYLYMKNQNN